MITTTSIRESPRLSTVQVTAAISWHSGAKERLKLSQDT
jgi:hypothetical protein